MKWILPMITLLLVGCSQEIILINNEANTTNNTPEYYENVTNLQTSNTTIFSQLDAIKVVDAAQNASIAAKGNGNVTSSNGTIGYFARFTNSTNVNTGSVYDDGTRIGINTTTPTATLEVKGAIYLPLNNPLVLGNTNNNSNVTIWNSGANAASLRLQASGGTFISGQTVVGATFGAFNSTLNVVGNTSLLGTLYVKGGTAGGTNSSIQGDGINPYILLSTAVGSDLRYSNNYFRAGSSQLVFVISNTEYARVTARGVGINTTTPSSSLTVVGNQEIVASANNAGLIINNTFAGRATTLQLLRPGSGGMFLTAAGGTPISAQIGAAGTTASVATINIIVANDSSSQYAIGDTTIGVSGTSVNPALFVAYNRTRIGLGTNRPNSTFEVLGNASFTGDISTKQNLTVLTEAIIGGISADGSGKVVCIKANGYLGTCTSIVDVTGACTCA